MCITSIGDSFVKLFPLLNTLRYHHAYALRPSHPRLRNSTSFYRITSFSQFSRLARGRRIKTTVVDTDKLKWLKSKKFSLRRNKATREIKCKFPMQMFFIALINQLSHAKACLIRSLIADTISPDAYEIRSEWVFYVHTTMGNPDIVRFKSNLTRIPSILKRFPQRERDYNTKTRDDNPCFRGFDNFLPSHYYVLLF